MAGTIVQEAPHLPVGVHSEAFALFLEFQSRSVLMEGTVPKEAHIRRPVMQDSFARTVWPTFARKTTTVLLVL